MRHLVFAASTAVVLGASGPAMADVVFTDGSLPVASFTKSSVYLNGVSVSEAQCASCGDPGKAFVITQTVTGTSGSGNAFSQAFAKTAFEYTPMTEGAIGSISASIDKDVTFNSAVSNFGNSFRPTIEQGGVFYVATVTGAALSFGAGGGSTGFLNFSATGLTASDFLSYNFGNNTFGSANPNFDGGKMLFGFTQLSTFNTSAGFVDVIRYDNLSFDIAPAAAVPEAGSLALLGTALAGFAGLTGWRRGGAARG